MKTIFSLIISMALVVSGYAQTRNVLVGTNNTVVQPTNFWSADASNARTGLGLGTAATNDASAFQPASLSLSNLSSSNGGALTNLQATNLVGLIPTSNIPPILLTNIGTITIAQGGTSATNAANARQNLGSTAVGDALFIATNAASARTTLGATTVGGSVFTAIDAAAARTALSLGTAATNPASAFQPSSTVLSNLASSNAVNLTNLQATNITGLIPASNISSVAISNLTGTVAIASGGTGATNAGGARNNLGIGTIDVVTFRGLIISNITNDSVARFVGQLGFPIEIVTSDEDLTAGYPAPVGSIGNGGGVFQIKHGGDATEWGYPLVLDEDGTNLNVVSPSTNIYPISYQIVFNRPLSFGTNSSAATTRTNLGLGATWLTNTNVTNFRTAVGLGATNDVVFQNITISDQTLTLSQGAEDDVFVRNESGNLELGTENNGTYIQINAASFSTIFNVPINFNNTTNAATTRTNLGLGWSALTNSNAGTSLVSVNTNGQVVSPTNFWQVAPIQTLVQDLTLIGGTQTNNATNARNLYVYSLNTNLGGVSNTIILPTNAATFNGDEATVVHRGTTNTTTVIRQAGSTNNLITLSRFDESVKFIRELGQWDFYHNISYIEPIFFSGTNASANAAASRTNLGLGATWLTNTNVTNFRTAVGLGENDAPTFSSLSLDSGQIDLDPSESLGQQLTGLTVTTNAVVFSIASETFVEATTNNLVIHRAPTYSSTNVAAATRTNLGLGETNNVTFSNVTTSGTLTATSTVTAKTNLVVEGHLDFTTNATNSNPATNNQINDFIEIRVGTNQFWLPVYK